MLKPSDLVSQARSITAVWGKTGLLGQRLESRDTRAIRLGPVVNPRCRKGDAVDASTCRYKAGARLAEEQVSIRK